jgi:hypothetical protein
MSNLPPTVQTSTSPAQSFRSQYDLAFQVSPIILQNGIVTAQGHLAPITDYTGGSPASLDDAFARYLPMPGSTLISQTVATYPFANQSVAANATIQQPLTISLLMIAPVNQESGYQAKLSLFTALQNTLHQHNALGGTYIVATPAFVYSYVIMTAMTDVTPQVSADGGKQVQIMYQLDWIQPLVTSAALTVQQGALMQTITNGNKITGQPRYSGNPSSSPANQTGVVASLGNVTAAGSSFGVPTPSAAI